MQTFLPYPDFSKSATVLDYRRLGKQRVECKQLLSALGYAINETGVLEQVVNPKAGWANHPAAKMWRGYEVALAYYQLAMILEWKRRGYNNTMLTVNMDNAVLFMNPPWLGDEAFHSSHRSNLLRKDPAHYGQFGWTDDPTAEYIWPTVPVKGPQAATTF
jgi:hypothetical protein